MPIIGEGELLIALILFGYGLIVGSFLNVCIYRLPRGKSIISPSSSCPNCNKPIPWYDNIPLLSYVLLRGRCRFCGSPISYIYPLVEFITAFFFSITYLWHGLSLQLLIDLLFICLLILFLFIDLFHQILPNSLTISGLIVGFGFSFFNKRINWWESLAGILLGGGILLGISLFYYYVKKIEGMGMGDVKMMAMVGAFLGWKLGLLTIILGSFLGALIGILSIIKSKEGLMKRLPFGTFLSLAALISLFFGQQLIYYYQWLISNLLPVP